MTLLVFSLVIAAVVAIIGTPLFIGVCLLIARMKRTGNGRGRRPPATPDRARARSAAPPFADGRRRDGSRARAGSQRGYW
jgi:hypothetical protein